MDHVFAHVPIDGHWGCVHVLATVNHASMNTHVQVFLCGPSFLDLKTPGGFYPPGGLSQCLRAFDVGVLD